jgi:hypothetical protein
MVVLVTDASGTTSRRDARPLGERCGGTLLCLAAASGLARSVQNQIAGAHLKRQISMR